MGDPQEGWLPPTPWAPRGSLEMPEKLAWAVEAGTALSPPEPGSPRTRRPGPTTTPTPASWVALLLCHRTGQARPTGSSLPLIKSPLSRKKPRPPRLLPERGRKGKFQLGDTGLCQAQRGSICQQERMLTGSQWGWAVGGRSTWLPFFM